MGKKKRRETEVVRLAVLAAVLELLTAVIGLATQIIESLRDGESGEVRKPFPPGKVYHAHRLKSMVEALQWVQIALQAATVVVLIRLVYVLKRGNREGP